MTLPSKSLLLFLVLLPSQLLAQWPSGLRFSHHDWELACDNTRTCRAAGYHSDNEEMAVSVLLTRKAGPNEPVTGQVMIGHYEENPKLDSLPAVFELSLRINDRLIGQVAIAKDSFVADLSSSQVDALLASLVRTSRIELSAGEAVWSLSDKGATAVLLKMDEYQGRINTLGALVKKGAKDEKSVLPAEQVPVVIAAPLPTSLSDDQPLAMMDSKALMDAIHTTLGEDDCQRLTEAEGENAELTATRLNDTKVLISAQCWMGAYNFGYGFWIINASSPYQPILVTTMGSDHSDGVISASHKGRGLGDCWSSEAWTWDGEQFVHTEASTSGLCKLMAPGGAWTLPTLVTSVRSDAT
ncbi:DUF1176 domain-containing protein [Nitrincola nitratireducens]|uniref:DUF1176 domain-containing protein n=1 Tax=Nitrincola nitratireducens TaxID=1229521 RepID=W9VI15_9GAMM|nr:DUF1176 domain-containing protein [Nitrincola nitratireducens]EXJ10245.1 hypothetical protein D791_02803 [Nitrincola nitratireducens]